MTKMFLMYLLISTSIIMLFLNNPLSMGLMILMQTLMICLLSGMLIKTYWFSYILFLTFLGGLLVLFIYVSSIASNELFKLSFKMMIFMITSFFFICILKIIFFNNLSWMNLYSFNFDMEKFNSFMLFNNNKINLNKIYNNQIYLLTIMMVIYLFITLLAIVKITNLFYGPLRANN
uniref:NADH-ubiquinone oxidoreductase chain 6 n=1 Tax=Sinna extrema TaxID=1232046 RepID=A0A5J6NAH4_9NEOP|nr:NADH dehydrogenase subunit 6 [Sinna extrema]QEX51411.1 NADH dehydrogenase subunit 6 [Sinna extrema]